MNVPLYHGDSFTEALYQQAFSIVAAEKRLKQKKKAGTMEQKLNLFFSMCVVLFLLSFIFLILWFVSGRVDVYKLVLVCSNLLIGAMNLRIVLMLKRTIRCTFHIRQKQNSRFWKVCVGETVMSALCVFTLQKERYLQDNKRLHPAKICRDVQPFVLLV